jgi:hypothetical protein
MTRTTPPGAFTKTEALRRLRKLAAEARRVERVPRNARVEVGERNVPVVSMTVPATFYAEGDDLDSCLPFADAVDRPGRFDLPLVAGPGYVVHLYVSTVGPWGEFVGVCCGWMGTADAEPVLLDADGRPLEDDRGDLAPDYAWADE